MPIYEYTCIHCGRIETVFNTNVTPVTPVCSYCGYIMQRKYSTFSNHFTPSRKKNE